jgi:hypothetical protein
MTKVLTVVTERTDGIQALYVDGILRDEEEVVYFTEALKFVEPGEPVLMEHHDVDLPESVAWPETLQRLKDMQGGIPDPAA